MRKLLATALTAIVTLALLGCGDESPPAKSKASTTAVTEENYALAETQIIFADYMKRIAAATDTNGVGILLHNRQGADPADRTVMRINFDTIYSFAVLDLTEDATLTMPETDGRYQSAWVVTEEHYNPMAFVTPGVHVLTRENVGARYATVIIRTQANTADAADMKQANALQDELSLEQQDRGSYPASHNWDMDEVLKMRAHFMAIVEAEGMTADVMFGTKEEVPLKEHNAGTAYGWGGLTKERAVYPGYLPTSTAPQTLTLEDVPAKAFWSVTIYDNEGFPQGNAYNINSQFAVPDGNGAYIIHFGGDDAAPNYLDIFEGWNFTLRIYEPTEAYFNGEWVRPELMLIE